MTHNTKKPDSSNLYEKVYTEEEFQKMMSAALSNRRKIDGLQTAVMISIGGRCGLRTSEVLSLTPSHFNFEEGMVSVETLKQRGKDKRRIRTIPVDQNTLFLLHLLISEKNIKDDERLFPFEDDAVRHRIMRICEHAGIPYKGFKGLRHFFCTTMAPYMQAQELAKLSGHRNLSILLETYYHPNPVIMREKYNTAVEAALERQREKHLPQTKKPFTNILQGTS